MTVKGHCLILTQYKYLSKHCKKLDSFLIHSIYHCFMKNVCSSMTTTSYCCTQVYILLNVVQEMY